MANKIQLRRDTAANWTAANPVLAQGEPGVEIDTGRAKYGDGIKNWQALSYAEEAPFLQSGTGAKPRSVNDKLKDIVSVKDFGALGNGVKDDTAAIQAALDLGISIFFPTGIYKVTSELVLRQGSKIIGEGCYSGIDSLTVFPGAIDDGTTIIRYDGPAGANVTVVRASPEVVGVEPVTDVTRNLQNVGVMDVVLDGGGKAGIGLYIVRALLNCAYERITVTGTTGHAFLIPIGFGGKVQDWMAFINAGAGITIGRNLYGWASWGVDQTNFDSCWAFRCGHNTSRVELNGFSEATPEAEYGIGVYRGRSLVFINAQSTYNGGVGVYLECDRWPIKFLSSYIEFNCMSSAATTKWGIWFKGATSGVSRSVYFDGIYMNGPTGQIDGIRLTGVQPSRPGENAVVFERLIQGSTINADWRNYRLTDVDNTIAFAGSKPNYIGAVVNGQYNMNISGSAAIATAAGAISSSTCSGCIASVDYIGAGHYKVNFSATLVTTKYLAIVTGNENRYLSIANKGVNGFEIKSTSFASGAFAAADSGTVNVLVIGGYQY